MNKHVCIIDGNSLMHRGYHAIKFAASAPDGTPTNAVYGFMNMFFRYVDALKPDFIVCAFDAGKCTHRLDILPTYKANRVHMDDELRVQFPIVEELLASMDVPIIKMEGWEGDDILGSVGRMCSEKGIKCSIVTGDKDANQLIDDNVQIVTSSLKGEIQIRDAKYVMDKYGLEVSQFVDFLALMGDSVDNIPGVTGVGEKKAADLLKTYGSLDGIYEHTGELKGKLKENIENSKENAYISREVAEINSELDLCIDVEHGRSFKFDLKDATAQFQKYSVYKPIEALKKTIQILSENNTDDEVIESVAYPDSLDADQDIFGRIREEVESGGFVALSYVAPTKRQLRSNPDLASVMGVASKSWTAHISPSAEIVKYLLETSVLIGYDVKDIVQIAYPHDTCQTALVDEKCLLDASYFDIHVLANSINSSEVFSKPEEFFSAISSDTFSADDDIFDKAERFAYLVLLNMDKMADDLSAISDDASYVFNNIDMPLVGTLSIFERNGCFVDDATLSDIGNILRDKIAKLTSSIYEIAGEEFNIDSPKILSEILFDKLNINSSKKTKTGKSTSVDVLRELKDEYPICGYVIEYREYTKLLNTYIDALPKIKLSDNLVHTTFNLATTATGRLSSTDPNLQNIPVRSDLGRQIRTAFLPLRDGDVFLSADYSQIELRLLAHLSGDENLIAAFKSGEDFHAETASRIFGVPIEQVTLVMRSQAKAVNFGIVYGQQSFTLSKQINTSVAEAKELIDSYYRHYPGVLDYLNKCVSIAALSGYAETMFGRKRAIPELSASNSMRVRAGERIAKNMPMQGSAADIIKLAMTSLQRELLEEGLQSKIMVQVHDELDISVPKVELDRVTALVKEVMEGVVELKVPLIVDVSYGANWAEAH